MNNSKYTRNFFSRSFKSLIYLGDLLLSECPENGDNLLRVFHFINDTFQNDSDNFVPSAPSTFPDDSVLLDPYTHNLTFEHWIVLDWVGASQCHVTYMRDIRDSLSGVVDSIIWFSDYDEWTGNVEHFQSEADLINERKAQLRVAVETNHTGPEVLFGQISKKSLITLF